MDGRKVGGGGGLLEFSERNNGRKEEPIKVKDGNSSRSREDLIGII